MMSKVSKSTASQHSAIPGLTDSYSHEVDGWSVEMETWFTDMDFAFSFKGLPNDLCPLSHVGYVLKGSLTTKSADGVEEVYEAGDAYVLTPGHTFALSAGAEFVAFTPITDESRAAGQVIQANMMKYAQEHGIDVSA